MFVRPAMQQKTIAKQQGFTLIELVAGIVVMAFLGAMFLASIAPHLLNSVRPQMQIRAAEFGQSLMAEIASRKFDEVTPLGSTSLCTSASCTSNANLGSDAGEGTNRQLFDDIDDYDEFCDANQAASDILGDTEGLSDIQFRVCVFYDNDYNGVDDAARGVVAAKLISVAVYPPSLKGGVDTPIYFTAYRGNF